jgi:hypothetical protein
MVMAYRGQDYPAPWLECVSGEPFGFTYLRNPHSPALFAVNGYVYHRAGQHLLRTLNYEFSFTGAASDDEALTALAAALRDGPVVAGMLDMGYLTYAPNHRDALGSDHAIVVLALQPNRVIVHDPAGYISVPLPLPDFLEAWRRDIYTGVPYGLWRIGQQGARPSDESIWHATLARARENCAWTQEDVGGGLTLIYGAGGMRALAADVRAMHDASLESLMYFGWRVSAQRCFDSARFLQEKLPEAAAIRWEQAQLYGELQSATAAGARDALPDLLERQAEHEIGFVAALGA